MSRISRAPIAEGDTIAAADLNDRFDDYTQSGSAVAGLNGFNLRDAAIDLPQLKKDWLCSAVYEATLGEFDLYHSSVNTVSGNSGAKCRALGAKLLSNGQRDELRLAWASHHER